MVDVMKTDFTDNKQFLSLHNSRCNLVCDGSSNFFFILISQRTVNMPITCIYSILNSLLYLTSSRL